MLTLQQSFVFVLRARWRWVCWGWLCMGNSAPTLVGRLVIQSPKIGHCFFLWGRLWWCLWSENVRVLGGGYCFWLHATRAGTWRHLLFAKEDLAAGVVGTGEGHRKKHACRSPKVQNWVVKVRALWGSGLWLTLLRSLFCSVNAAFPSLRKRFVRDDNMLSCCRPRLYHKCYWNSNKKVEKEKGNVLIVGK